MQIRIRNKYFDEKEKETSYPWLLSGLKDLQYIINSSQEHLALIRIFIVSPLRKQLLLWKTFQLSNFLLIIQNVENV